MMYIWIIRLLTIIICKVLFKCVESKVVLCCSYDNDCEISTHSQTTVKQKPSINISKLDEPSFKFLNIVNKESKTNFNFWKICHSTFIKKYEYIHVYVFDINHDFFKHEEIYEQFGPALLYTEAFEMSITSKATIIFIHVYDELHKIVNKKTTLWNQSSIFVIVILQCLRDIQIEMEALWKYHKIYKYVLLCGKENPAMYIYRPFVRNGEKRVCEVKKESEIVDNIVHAVDDLYGSVVRIILFPQDFFAITDNGKYIGGGDYSPLEVLQKKMNFSPIISLPTDGKKFTLAHQNFTGSIRDIVLGVADVAFNGHFLKDYGTDDIVFTRYVYMDKLCFIVPMPTYNSPYTMIVHIFSTSTWLLLAFVYLITIIIYYIFEIFTTNKHRKSRYDDLWLHTFAIFIFGATSLKINNNPKRLLIGGVLLNILIVNNAFQGSLRTVLSKPTRKQPIETLAQIINSNLVLVSENVDSLIDDPDLLQSLYFLQERQLRESVNFVKIRRIPASHVQGYRNHLRYGNDSMTEQLHIVSEYIQTDFVSFVLPKNSPLLDRINAYLIRFHESGLTSKWLGSDVSLMIEKMYKPLKDNELETKAVKNFTLNDLTFAFTFLFVGLGLSSVVFLFEYTFSLPNKPT